MVAGRDTTIPMGHHDMAWLFGLDLDRAGADGLLATASDPNGALAQALGLPLASADHIDVIDIGAISVFGLPRYLTEAVGLSDAQVTAQSDMLSRLTGLVLLVRSRALGDGPGRFTPNAPLRLLARFGTDTTIHPLTPLRSSGATGVIEPGGKAPKSDARIGGMVATVALLVAGLLVALMVWISG